jgi:hypothetical protein
MGYKWAYTLAGLTLRKSTAGQRETATENVVVFLLRLPQQRITTARVYAFFNKSKEVLIVM